MLQSEFADVIKNIHIQIFLPPAEVWFQSVLVFRQIASTTSVVAICVPKIHLIVAPELSALLTVRL